MASATEIRSSLETRTRTVSSNEAKQHWDAMMKAPSEGEDVVIDRMARRRP